MIGDAERSKLQVGYKQAVRALNNNRVRYWHEKGYKVNEINEFVKFLNLK